MDKYFIDQFYKRSSNFQRVSCWVFIKDERFIEIFNKEMPNTEEIWIEFYEMNHYFWSLAEETCVDEIQGHNERDVIVLYNNFRLKKFFIKYMIKDWCFGELKRNLDGSLTDESVNYVFRLHPNILKTLLNGYTYKSGFTLEEEGKIQKQCYLLFDKGQGIKNPHKYISLYCDLVSFWSKFGLNYFDIQKLPQDVYDGLRKIMNSENQIDSMKLNRNAAKNNNGRGSTSSQIRF